jgi:aspartyl-tRNA(Asn)/glutamyl-tRNA(Gln) amidotransferase subunit C
MFSHDEVAHLARLARLDLSVDEIELFGRQLDDILKFARQVEAADTSTVTEATLGPDPAVDTLRDDVAGGSLQAETALADAPAADRATGLFTVPPVLNG